MPRLLGFGQRRVEGRGEKTIAVGSSELLQSCCDADPIRFRHHPRWQSSIAKTLPYSNPFTTKPGRFELLLHLDCPLFPLFSFLWTTTPAASCWLSPDPCGFQYLHSCFYPITMLARTNIYMGFRSNPEILSAVQNFQMCRDLNRETCAGSAYSQVKTDSTCSTNLSNNWKDSRNASNGKMHIGD